MGVFDDMMQQMMGTAFNSLGGQKSQPGEVPGLNEFSNMYGGDPTITGTALGMGQPSQYPIPQIAPQSGRSWFSTAFSSLLAGLSFGGDANDPASAFAKGLQGVELQRRQQQLEMVQQQQLQVQQDRVQQAWEASRAKSLLDLMKVQQDMENAPKELQIKATQADASLIAAMAAAHKSPAFITNASPDGMDSFKAFVQQSGQSPWSYIPVHTADGRVAFYQTDPYDMAPDGTPDVRLPDGSSVQVAGKPWTFSKDLITNYLDNWTKSRDAQLAAVSAQNVANIYAGATKYAADRGTQINPDDRLRSIEGELSDVYHGLGLAAPVGASDQEMAAFNQNKQFYQQRLGQLLAEKQQLMTQNTQGPKITAHEDANFVYLSNGTKLPKGQPIPGMESHGVLTGIDTAGQPVFGPATSAIQLPGASSPGAASSYADQLRADQIDNTTDLYKQQIVEATQAYSARGADYNTALQLATDNFLQSNPQLPQDVLDSLKRKLMLSQMQVNQGYTDYGNNPIPFGTTRM